MENNQIFSKKEDFYSRGLEQKKSFLCVFSTSQSIRGRGRFRDLRYTCVGFVKNILNNISYLSNCLGSYYLWVHRIIGYRDLSNYI